MHHALRVQEILLAIFNHWRPSLTYHRCRYTAILAVLARTCRSFKDMALDILWSELIDLSPLPRCIPEAYRVDYGHCYSFKRQLDEKEWATLLSYTRRVRHIRANPAGVHILCENDSRLVTICSARTGHPLFPNLQTLYWEGRAMIPAMHVAVPSLTMLMLNLRSTDCDELKEFLNTIGDLCRNLIRVDLCVSEPQPNDVGDIIRSHIHRLAHIRELKLVGVTADVDMIACLSEMSALERLSIKLDPAASDFSSCSRSAYVFPVLVRLELSSMSPAPATEILSCIQLPALEDLKANFTSLPLKKTLTPFISAVQKVRTPNSLTSLHIRVFQRKDVGVPSENEFSFDDLYPCTAFTHLRCLVIDLPRWTVVTLTDSDMHALVSVWPHLHTLSINHTWGWRTDTGITFRSLVQILNMCRSLVRVCIAIDTASHTDLPPTHELKYLPLDPSFEIDFADSWIRSPDVPGLVEAIRKLGLHRSFVVLDSPQMQEDEEEEEMYLGQASVWGLVKKGLRAAPEHNEVLVSRC